MEHDQYKIPKILTAKKFFWMLWHSLEPKRVFLKRQIPLTIIFLRAYQK